MARVSFLILNTIFPGRNWVSSPFLSTDRTDCVSQEKLILGNDSAKVKAP